VNVSFAKLVARFYNEIPDLQNPCTDDQCSRSVHRPIPLPANAIDAGCLFWDPISDLCSV